MRMKNLSNFFIGMLAMCALAACSDNELGNDPDVNTGTSKDAVYMNVTVQLPTAGGSTRSKTDTDESQDDYGSSDSGTEEGQNYENVVNSVVVVLAKKGTNEFIACGTQDGLATPDGNGKINVVQSIEKTDLLNYYGNNTLTEEQTRINVYVFCNPTVRLQRILEDLAYGDKWIDEKGKVIETSNGEFTETGQDGGYVWGGSEHKSGFLMATAKEKDIEKKLPKTFSSWDDHNTAERAFDLTGMNYSGTANEINNGGSIHVERAVARFDFKDGSPDGTPPRTYNVVKYVEGEGETQTEETLIQIKLTKMALVNMSKEFYYLRRVSDDGSDKDNGFPTTNTNDFAYCGLEKTNNYVVDTDPDFKKQDLKTVNNKEFAKHFNFCFGDDTGDEWTINETARGQWYTSDISKVLEGKNDNDDGWNATQKEGYRIWRYATENTIPGEDTGFQRHGISTGIVFKGKMIVPDALQNNPKYADLYKYINNVKGDDGKEALTGRPDEDPILYAHSGELLFVRWTEVRAYAIKNRGTFPKFYSLVFGNSETEPVAESGTEGETDYQEPVYSTDDTSPDYWWARWQDRGNLETTAPDMDTEADEAGKKFKKIATSENVKFTLYQSSEEEIEKEDGKKEKVKGYYCYYYYWNRHNDNGLDTSMGPMEFGVVRNNVYKLAVTEISQLGHPRLSENDPDPENPDNPDESGKIYFKVSVKVLPWVVRVNNIKF